MDAAEFFTLDEWHQNTHETFQIWKRYIKDIQRRASSNLRILGVTVDFQYNILQSLALNFQSHFHFIHLAKRWKACYQPSGKCFLAGTFFSSWEERMGFSIPEIVEMPTLHWMAILDRIWQWVFAVADSLRKIYFLLRKTQFDVGTKKKFRYIWTDINPSEVALGPERFDFAFLVERNLIPPDECLYLFLKKPTTPALYWLKKRGIRWARLTGYDAMLTFPQRLYAIGGICLMLFNNLFLIWNSRAHVPLLIRFCIQAYPWVLIAKTFPLSVYLATASSDLCERPAVAVMNALGIRTVNWSYSSNYFGYVTNWNGFKDLSLFCTLFVSKEVWLWNKTIVDWVKDRSVFPSNPSQIRVTGPIMSGDSLLMIKDSNEVRQENGLTAEKDVKYIAVFDVPTHSKKQRLTFGLGPPWYPIEILEGFFTDLMEVLNRFPNIRLIIKLKRSLNDPSREYPASLGRLIDPHSIYYKERRVIQLHSDSDPYLAIAMADFCIGIPFTSPVVVGFYSGKEGVFHDPLCTFNFFRPQILKPFMTRGREELMAKISDWLNHQGNSSLEHLDHLNKELYYGLSGDPTMRFFQLLENQQDETISVDSPTREPQDSAPRVDPTKDGGAPLAFSFPKYKM